MLFVSASAYLVTRSSLLCLFIYLFILFLFYFLFFYICIFVCNIIFVLQFFYFFFDLFIKKIIIQRNTIRDKTVFRSSPVKNKLKGVHLA